MMKNKRQSEGTHNNRHPSSQKGQGLTKRGNKENYIQMTEPLDSNHQTYPSKEFILSRESVSQASKSVLKDISNGKRQQRCQQTAAKAEKSQRSHQGVFDRRLSLKCTGNYSQQLDYQKSQRLSMAPLRRQSLGQVTAPQSLLDERESLSSINQNSLFCSDSKSKQIFKKQTIITNLMHKLDHEQDLRSIIESKLKSGSNSILNSSYQPHLKEKRNQSYVTDYTEDQNQNQQLASKLRQCENEVVHFREVIREMSEKIMELTEEKKANGRNRDRESEGNWRLAASGAGEDAGFQYGGNGNGRQSYRECYRNDAKSIGIQVDSGPVQKKDKERVTIQHMEKEKGRTKEREVSSSDFFDNLQKTIKVLGGTS